MIFLTSFHSSKWSSWLSNYNWPNELGRIEQLRVYSVWLTVCYSYAYYIMLRFFLFPWKGLLLFLFFNSRYDEIEPQLHSYLRCPETLEWSESIQYGILVMRYVVRACSVVSHFNNILHPFNGWIIILLRVVINSFNSFSNMTV